jgi:dTDP-4-dehydrorhamnose reductase
VRVVVTGSNGQVGREVVESLETTGHTALAAGSADITSPELMREHITDVRPDAVIHCAAFTDVDGCELDPDRAMSVNGDGTRNVIEAAAAVDAFVVTLSTDYVFDGVKPAPYVESDAPNPLSAYGRSKLAAEDAVNPEAHAIVRTSWVCGHYGKNMVKTILRLAAEHDQLSFVRDQRGHPTIVADLAPMLVRIADERRAGIWHVTNQGAVSWYEFAQAVMRAAGHDPKRVHPITTAELQPPRPAPRPANSVLDSERLAPHELLPDFRDSLPDLVANLRL